MSQYELSIEALRDEIAALKCRQEHLEASLQHIAQTCNECGQFALRASENPPSAAPPSAAPSERVSSAGQGEHNVLALIDHYQIESMHADERLREALELLRIIKEADMLREHAYDRGDDDASVVEAINNLLATK